MASAGLGPGATPPRSVQPSASRLPPSSPDHIDYIKRHDVERLLVEALTSAVDSASDDPAKHIADFMRARSRAARGQPTGRKSSAEAASSAYMSTTAVGVARERTAWLLFFLFGLLLCASVMHKFEALLARELELAFFVPLLIGHGGNSGGQVVSTVIRALGSGAAKLRDAPRVIAKEATAGVMQSLVLVCALAPALYYGMGISAHVTAIVSIALPCLGLLANSLGSALPFAVTAAGRDPAVIVGPLMTTSVDSLGLMLYLLIATVFFALATPGAPEPACHRAGFLCVPSNDATAGCKRIQGACVGVAL